MRAVLDGIDHRRLPAEEQQDWYRLRGAVEFQTKQRARAREIFEDAVGHFPASGWLNFGLGQEYEFLGRSADMRTCFERVRVAEVGAPTALAMARYAYLWNQFDLGQRLMQPIFDRYYELKIVDDTFLYIRGLPGFDEAFGYRAAFARLSGTIQVARAELAHARAALADGSFDQNQLDLEATASGDWRPVLDRLAAVLAGLPGDLPSGRLRMKQALLRSRLTSTLEAGLAELAAVRLTPDDHAWLEDIRTLARAELCHRFDLAAEEETALATFFGRQALLFEPNHAFDFGLLDYQERIKSRYRAMRQASTPA